VSREIPLHRNRLLHIYHSALAAVHGRRRVADCLSADPFPGPFHLIAVGKAAAAMVRGVLDVQPHAARRCLVVCPHGAGRGLSRLHDRLQVVEAGHPVPDEGSLRAGRVLREFVAASPPRMPFLVLVSGGASALLELPRPGLSLSDLQRVNRWLLASGLAIGEMNAVRRRLSLVKGGGLSSLLAGRRVRGLLISDVPGDDPAVIGSGLLARGNGALPARDLPGWLQTLLDRAGNASEVLRPETFPMVSQEIRVIATNRDGRRAAARAGRARGYAVFEHDALLVGDVAAAAEDVAAQMASRGAGLHVWGGEVTVRLPPMPGRGGRCQHLALLVARRLQHESRFLFLAAGTDGRDGSGEAAGALVDAYTLRRACQAGLRASDCLRRAASGELLAATGDLVVTGETGSNVMDVMLGLKWD